MSADEEEQRGEAKERQNPMKSRRFRRIALAVLVIAVLLGAFWFYRHQSYGRFQEDTNNAYIRADFVAVAPKVAGYVEEVFVVDNQPVHAGQPLVRIDNRQYEARAAETEAQVQTALANARGIEANIREQEASVTQSQAQLATSQSDLSFAESEVARYTPLAASGAETRERLAQLRNNRDKAANTVRSGRAALEVQRRRIETLRAQLAQARAQADAARAQVKSAQVDLGSTLIRASTAGRVGDKSVRVGQYVQSGTRLMSIVPTANIYLEANFKETQIGRMRVGQPARIEVDALPGAEIHGVVESISPGTGAQFSLLPPQNATGNFTKIVQRVPVRIRIDAGPEARQVLVPGLSVEVTVDTRSARDAEKRIKDEAEQRSEARGR